MIRSIALVTDFGVGGPYVGQLLATLHRRVPGVPVYPLMSDLPPFRPDLAAYLLPALVRDLPKGALYLCVVDPGVGSDRNLLWLNADGNRYLGPDNGMLAIVAKQGAQSHLAPDDLAAKAGVRKFSRTRYSGPGGGEVGAGETAAIPPDWGRGAGGL